MVNLRSYGLVLIQFAAILAIVATGPWFAANVGLQLLEVAGIGLGLWAVLAMRLTNLHILPDVRPNAQLIQRGPYRLIRHPMYSALLVTTGVLVISAFSWLRLGFWLVLLVDLLIKLRYEEGLLLAHHPGYNAYQQQTKRLVPFVY